MKRLPVAFAIAGAVIPILLLGLFRLELLLDLRGVPLTRSVWPYLWPSHILLGATAGGGTFFTQFIVVTIVILVNVLVYALLGFLIKGSWELILWTRKRARL